MKKIAVLFPGQGIRLDAVTELLQTQGRARSVFQEANEALGKDLFELLKTQSTPDQAVIVTTNVAYFECFIKGQNLLPAIHFMAGHSLGEYCALICSGAISLKEMLPVIAQRQVFMESTARLAGGGMCVVQKTGLFSLEAQIEALCNEAHEISISAYNSPTQWAVSGSHEAINRLENRIAEQATFTHLNINGPFHSKAMSTAATQLRAVLEQVHFKNLHCPVYSSASGRLYQHSQDIKEGLINQISEPVRWQKVIEDLYQRQTGLFVNCGPAKTLESLIQDYQLPVTSLSLHHEEARETARQHLQDHLKNYASATSRSLVYATSIPMQKQPSEAEREVLDKQLAALWQIHDDNLAAERAMSLLKDILTHKGLNEEELIGSLDQLAFETGINCL